MVGTALLNVKDMSSLLANAEPYVDRYLAKVALSISEFGTRGKITAVELGQTHHMLKNKAALTAASTEVEERFLNKLGRFLSLRMKGIFHTLDLEELKRHATDYLVPTLNLIKTEFSKHVEWARCVSESALSEAMLMLESVIALNSEKGEGKEEFGALTFNLYLQFREVAKQASSPADELDRIYRLFETCLDLWVGAIHSRASRQVDTVIELERERHRGRIDWNELDRVDPEWMEGAREVGGIIKTCELTWTQLEWPDYDKNLEFGLKLTEKINVLFYRYINAFYDIIMEDDDFDRRELIIVLNSLAQSSGYLDSMFGKLSDCVKTFIRKSGSPKVAVAADPGVADKVTSFSASIDSCRRRAFDLADQMVAAFCRAEATLKLARLELFDEDDPEGCTLGRVNDLLKFFDSRLEMTTEQQVRYSHSCYNRLYVPRIEPHAHYRRKSTRVSLPRLCSTKLRSSSLITTRPK